MHLQLPSSHALTAAIPCPGWIWRPHSLQLCWSLCFCLNSLARKKKAGISARHICIYIYVFVAKHNYTNYAFRLPPSSIPASLSLPLPPSLLLSSLSPLHPLFLSFGVSFVVPWKCTCKLTLLETDLLSLRRLLLHLSSSSPVGTHTHKDRGFG